MCVIVHQPKGSHLEKERAKRLWEKNPHGGGFAFIDNTDTVQVERYMEFDEYWSAFESARSEFPKRDFLIHMRIATHGGIDLSNVHPFMVDEHTTMAHNGIIHGVPDCAYGRSDSRVFVDEVLPRLPETWLDDPYLFDMVQDWIGWSKLMFLTTNPKLEKGVYILNKKKGMTADGMWFSNSSGVHKPTYKVVSGGYQGYTNGKTWPKANKEYDDFFLTDDGYWSPREQEALDAVVTSLKSHEDTGKYTITKTEESLEEIFETTMYRETSFTVAEEREALRVVREQSWLFRDIEYDLDSNRWFCWGCDEWVQDEKTGECQCFLKVCMECEAFTTVCKCEPYPLEMKYYDKIPVEIRAKAVENLIHPKEGSKHAKTTKTVEQALARLTAGEGNTEDNDE